MQGICMLANLWKTNPKPSKINPHEVNLVVFQSSFLTVSNVSQSEYLININEVAENETGFRDIKCRAIVFEWQSSLPKKPHVENLPPTPFQRLSLSSDTYLHVLTLIEVGSGEQCVTNLTN
jgi:hypothetical protein